MKDDLLLVYPDTQTFEAKRGELITLKRKPGEILSDFYTKIRSKAGLLKEEKPAAEEMIKRDAVAAFLTTLPFNFQGKLNEADYLDPPKVYDKAVKYIRFNRELKLDNESIRKETRQSVAMVTPPMQATSSSAPQPLMSVPPRQAVRGGTRPRNNAVRRGNSNSPNSPTGTVMTCFRCGQLGHGSRVCRAPFCSRCGEVGHTSGHCATGQYRRTPGVGRGRHTYAPGWGHSSPQGWGTPQGKKTFHVGEITRRFNTQAP